MTKHIQDRTGFSSVRRTVHTTDRLEVTVGMIRQWIRDTYPEFEPGEVRVLDDGGGWFEASDGAVVARAFCEKVEKVER